MPLDKVLINHLDEMDRIEDAVESDVETIINGISIDDIISDAQGVLLGVVDQVQTLLEEKYYPQASEDGLSLADTIKKDGDIQIPKSKDPNLNKDLVDLDLAQGEQT